MYKRILALLDGPQTWRTVMSQVERLAGGREVEITLLAVAEPAAAAAEHWRQDVETRLEEQASILRRKGIVVHTAVRTGPPAQEIVAFTRDHPADVIVMAAPPRAA